MKTLLALFVILLIAPFCMAMEDYDAYTYAVSNGTIKVLEWAAPDSALGTPAGYEFYLKRMEDNVKVATGTATAKNTLNVRFTKHGHVVLWVRPFWMVDGAKQYGQWGNSMDPAVGVVNGEPRAWVVYVLQ